MIELKNVSKRYKTGTHALSDVSFTVNDGEFVFVMGPSGAGKSTLVKLLDGEEVPTSGKVIVSGVDVGRLKKSKVYLYRRKIGVVFQDFKLLPKKTVFENVAYALEVLDMPDDKIRKRVRDVLKLVDLSDKSNALPESLSGGQQQRVAIARSVVKKPMIIIADEPTGNLDPTLTDEMITLLEKINRDEKTTIIVVTHNTRTVETHPKRTIVIENGHVVSDSIYKPKKVEKKPEVVKEVVEPVKDGMLFSVADDEDDNDEEERKSPLEEKVLSGNEFHISLEPDDKHIVEEKVVETNVDNHIDEEQIFVENTEIVPEEVKQEIKEEVESVKETINQDIQQEIKAEPVKETINQDIQKEIEPEIVKEEVKIETQQEVVEKPIQEQPVQNSEVVMKQDVVSNEESVDVSYDDFTEQFSPIGVNTIKKDNNLADDEFIIEDFTSTNQIVVDKNDQDILQTALDEMNETIEMFKQDNKE